MPEISAMPWAQLLGVFLTAVVAALLLCPVAGWAGRKLGLVDRPRPGEVQKRETPRTGGYAIIVAFWIAVIVAVLAVPRDAGEQHRLLGLLIGSALILPIAVLDDFYRLSPKIQLIGQIVVACVPIGFGIMIDNVASPSGLLYLPLYFAVPLSLFWFVGMINTLNFIDTMDGMAGGVSAIGALILFLRAVSLEQFSIAALMLALMGAVIGFLPFNLPTARMFMGTAGSMFLGYSLALMALVGGAKIATTLMVLAIPIIDTALVIATRVFQGRSPFKGGDGVHFPHRLMAMGVPQHVILIGCYAFCLLLGYFALSLNANQKLIAFGAVAALLAIAILVIAYRSRGMARPPRPRNRASQPRPQNK